MKLDTNYLNKLKYKEISLKDIEIEIVQKDEETEGSGIGLRDEDKELTESALHQLCSFLKIPYAFTKSLRNQGRSNVIVYLKKQLSQANNPSVILVSNNDNILGITETEKLHYRGKEAITFDTRLEELVAAKNSPLELTGRMFHDGEILYSLLYRDPEKIDSDKESQGLWKSGFTISHSAIGSIPPKIGVELLRMVCVNKTFLPAKLHSYPMTFENDFEARWNYVASFLQNPPPPVWTTLNKYVTKLAKTTASLREVKDARSKMQKLKIDREDSETPSRIDAALQWKRINKAYDFKNMPDKPPKSWYSKASTPLSLFDVYNVITREATAAPNTIDEGLRLNLLIYGGAVLTSTPDLFMSPTAIDWSKN